MGDRRMISRQLVTDDSFLDMPFSARALYFTLVACADDDGFVNGPKSITRQIGATQEDLDTLVTNHYLFLFESGVVAIRHWKMQNYVPKDRYHPTTFKKEFNQLCVDKNGIYNQKPLELAVSEDVDNLYTDCIQDDDIPYTEVKLSKDKLSKVNIYTTNNPSVYDCSSLHSVDIYKELSTNPQYDRPIPIRKEGCV